MHDTGEGFGVSGDSLQMVWGSDPCGEERRMAGEETAESSRKVTARGVPEQSQVTWGSCVFRSETASVLPLCGDGMALGKPDSKHC